MSNDKKNTRNRILQSAWKLLESGSGSDVRMSDIAKEAGISRQAVYLHFPNRSDLLVETTRYLDDVKNVNEKLAVSRLTNSGIERLNAFIDAWGNYIPEIYGVAKALMAMMETDKGAQVAWNDRMQAVREGCKAAVTALEQENQLSAEHSVEQATEILWMLLSVRNWEHLTNECHWSQDQYIKSIKSVAHNVLVTIPIK
jgi:AcrR family transcriptional regulator